MSYETAQKVQQQQFKDRVVYAGIILLGVANEHTAWEKEHS